MVADFMKTSEEVLKFCGKEDRQVELLGDGGLIDSRTLEITTAWMLYAET